MIFPIHYFDCDLLIIIMDAQPINKKIQKTKPRYHHYPEPIIQNSREERFANRWSISERPKNYDALGDPFTSYYFSNKSVKQHLKELKRAIREEPNAKEKSRLSKLITLRMREKFQEYVCPKTLIYEQEMRQLEEQGFGHNSSKSIKNIKSIKSFKSHSKNNQQKSISKNNKKFKIMRGQLAPLNATVNNKSNYSLREDIDDKTQLREPSVATTHKQKETKDATVVANKLAQDLHEKKHNKWIQFLQDKKRLLPKIKFTDQSNTQDQNIQKQVPAEKEDKTIQKQQVDNKLKDKQLVTPGQTFEATEQAHPKKE